VFFEHQTMEKVQKHSNPDWNTLSSEPFRIELQDSVCNCQLHGLWLGPLQLTRVTGSEVKLHSCIFCSKIHEELSVMGKHSLYFGTTELIISIDTTSPGKIEARIKVKKKKRMV
jgi:hypothetical protein